MTGNKLEEIERAYVELFAGKKRLPSHLKQAREALAHDLSAALMQWQFDLETLKPDRGLPRTDRLRTPIAWMANGINGIRGKSPERSPPQSPSTDYPDEEYSAEEEYLEEESPPQSPSADYQVSRSRWIESSDFHGIMPRQMSCYDCRTSIIDLPVTTFQQEAREEDVQEMLPADKPVARKGPGWRYLCHRSNLANIDISDDDGVSGPSSGPEVSKHTTAAEGKAGLLPSFLLRVRGLPCDISGQTHSSHLENNFPCHAKATELAQVLPHYLAPTSSALRDVVLAHALVNGHEVLVEWLMSKETTTIAVLSTNGRRRESEQPVGPTLAHMRILQALERRPTPAFVDAIATGAPFKRGHLKSSLPCHKWEKDWEERDRRSAAKEDHNDRRLTSLFAERERLKRLDIADENRARVQQEHRNPLEGGSNIAQMASIGDRSHFCEQIDLVCPEVLDQKGLVSVSETEGEENQTEAEPTVTGTSAHKIMIIFAGRREEKVSLAELPQRHRSLCLWVEHLRLLQWFEERKEKRQRQEREGQQTANRAYCHVPRPSAFATSLSDMLVRLGGLKTSMEHLFRGLLDTRQWNDMRNCLKGVTTPQTGSKKRKSQPGEEDLAVNGRQGCTAIATAGKILVERTPSPETPCKRAKGDADADNVPLPTAS